jgi:SLT domain-containing protein
MVQRKTVKNFYRALAASAYVAGASAAGLALGGPPGAAAAASAATANLASPLGVAAVEIAAEVGTDAALDSTKMSMGGIVTEPTFAMIGEAGPEMVIPLTGSGALMSPLAKPKRKRSRSARAADKKLSKAFKEANARYRLKSGALRKGRTQADIARLAHKLRKKM